MSSVPRWQKLLFNMSYFTNLSVANERMQQSFPGPYKVVERFSPDRGVIEYSLKFNCKKQELMWMLKNGY